MQDLECTCQCTLRRWGLGRWTEAFLAGLGLPRATRLTPLCCCCVACCRRTCERCEVRRGLDPWPDSSCRRAVRLGGRSTGRLLPTSETLWWASNVRVGIRSCRVGYGSGHRPSGQPRAQGLCWSGRMLVEASAVEVARSPSQVSSSLRDRCAYLYLVPVLVMTDLRRDGDLGSRGRPLCRRGVCDPPLVSPIPIAAPRSRSRCRSRLWGSRLGSCCSSSCGRG